MKEQTPKRVYFRRLADGKLSVGEYINAKWRNVLDPFKINDETIEQLAGVFLGFQFRNPRPIELVAYRGGDYQIGEYLVNEMKKRHVIMHEDQQERI